MLLPWQAIQRGLVADSAEHNTLHIERVFIFFKAITPVLSYALFMFVNFHYPLYKIAIFLKRTYGKASRLTMKLSQHEITQSV